MILKEYRDTYIIIDMYLERVSIQREYEEIDVERVEREREYRDIQKEYRAQSIENAKALDRLIGRI